MAGIYNLLCIIVIITVFTIITAKDYCTMQIHKCKKKGSHTMCKYSSTPAVACGNSYKTGLSDAEIKAIVDKHNEYRQYVATGKEKRGKPGPQPAAVNMPNVTWDKELAKIAQRWVNQCIFDHDECRNVDRFTVGQNMGEMCFWGKYTYKVENFVSSWYNEVAEFNNNYVNEYKDDNKTGHYSQIVWANTIKIGCGRIIYKDLNRKGKEILGCNYGPSGNWLDEKMYKVKK